ncbi:ATP-dependent DNA helicase RecG [Candidatus Tenderia electrophaga]|jgi:ATP-dependent DNA helicase RecG|uniref:ATP-dependent DNA helicase RecG n=1 Tax=Candidatus Tenderia electrophaga TaxID=1748243 RepID=A0A0S2T990_9GAMM|nr:ATP-dependent DNA helicase RecG [Candidatus Tenderia electrophaga]
MTLSAPLTTLKGVGPRVAERLEKLGLRRVEDLLFHLPYRYQDRTRVVPIGALRPGEEAVVEGEIQADDIKFGKRRSLLCRLGDGSGSLLLRFFHFNASQRAALARGKRLRCYGEVRRGPAMLEMVHPEYHLIDAEAQAPMEAHLTPIYPTTEGMAQKSLRQLIEQALQLLRQGRVADHLPPELLEEYHLPSLRHALLEMHQPAPHTPVAELLEGEHPARQRLALEELLAQHLSLRQLRHKVQQYSAPPLAPPGHLRQRLIDALPFALTGAQTRVMQEIDADLARPHPMQRLVQGDVGSGKTVVAAAAAAQAIEAGYQVAVMAPTELLAEQHRRNFTAWLEPLGLTSAWLSGKSGAKQRRENLALLAEGKAALAVGTHALFQDEVMFDRLGLVIVDEQHRFGVHQRLALREKGSRNGSVPHQLIMTATPIPRTLAMTAYADLDSSVIDELPPGRTPVETVAICDERRDEVVARVHRACVGERRQAYWVCTLIEESEALQCQAAEDTAALLTEALPELRIGLVHGRMKAAEKARVMAGFKAGELQLLVATTVIEVGVDVPNASLMIIENAERLGLAQLHQLRGRVGRGSVSSSCVLMYHKPLSQQGRARLAALRETNDGFEIARRDLALRGPGELLGTRQSGMLRLRVADLERDRDLLPDVARLATALLQRWPQHVAPLIQRWLGDRQRYGDV